MKSPIKDRPLRNPGQSLDWRILDVVMDRQIKYVTYGLAVCLALVFNWAYYFSRKPFPPVWFTLFGLLFLVYCYYKIRAATKEIEPLTQGRDGEKAVGQYLELLREQGVKVFHDIPGDNFNLDHVLVAPSGVYVIETKTYSKPDKGDARIIYTGDSLIYRNGFRDDKPLVQVKAAANWLKQIIKESTGKDFNVREVVLFPGWFIESTAESRKSDVWVLEPKGLPGFISNSRVRLSGGDLNLVAYHLSRFVRAAGVG
ncbi:MAG: NERD domain-containing protein [Maribacter sp.]|nr:NERD domain-containing protein [Maribacter sp.]